MSERDPLGDQVRAAVEAIEVPDGPGVGAIRRRVRTRRRRRRVATGLGAATALALVVGAVATIGTESGDTQLTTAAPPGYDVEIVTPARGSTGVWEWRTAERLMTRTGEASGYGTRTVPGSTDLLVYLTDGPVCFDTASCAEPPAVLGAAGFAADYAAGDGGSLAALVGPGAPMAQWNVAVVPNVTGDFGAGTKVADVPDGPVDQQFIGARNLQVILRQLAAEGEEQGWDRAVLLGSGTGGIGAVLDTPTTIDAFGPALVAVIVDGGALPPSDDLLPTCVVQRWGELSGLGFPSDFAEFVTDAKSNRVHDSYEYLGRRYPDLDYALISARNDAALPDLFRVGVDGCERPVPPVDSELLAQGIDDLDSQLDDLGTWDGFVIDGADPTPLTGPGNPALPADVRSWLDQMLASTDP